VLGDGRFAGLGVMRPVQALLPGLHVFFVDRPSAPPISRSVAVAAALRRAVMARAQAYMNASGCRYSSTGMRTMAVRIEVEITAICSSPPFRARAVTALSALR
jgi:hypothetical protein